MKHYNMKIGIVDIGWKEISKDSLTSQALGGSETWLLSITKEFVKKGYDVTVFCNTKEEWMDGARFVPLYHMIDKFIAEVSEPYDFIILNRIIRKFDIDIITVIRQYNATQNIFIQMHDLSLLYNDHIASKEEIDRTGIFDKRVRGIVLLTEWHKSNFEKQYPNLNSIPKYIIPNGVDIDLIPKEKPQTDNRILWSSCAERGLDILLEMYDDIKSKVPDFGIDIAGYNDLSQLNKFDIKDKDVRVLGNLPKDKLYEEMNKHKVWFYPGTFAETFCITMVENMLCKNFVVSPFTYGTQDILSADHRDRISLDFRFDDGRSIIAKNQAANYIIAVLTNKYCHVGEPKYIHEVTERNYQECLKYTWINTADGYINIYKHIYKQDNLSILKEHLKGVFLAQSCNLPFFKKELAIVENTWAKELIEDKHPGYKFFSYTSCDDTHPTPCIDGNTIYVLNDDSIEHTYEKMRDAYQLLLDKYDFDVLFRTNTSTFINVPLAIQRMECLKEKEIVSDICGYYHVIPNMTPTFMFNTFVGAAYIISRKIADSIFLSRYDSSISNVQDGDDIISCYIINELYNPGEIEMKSIVVSNDASVYLSYRYKGASDLSKTYDQISATDELNKKRYISDPSIVNDQIIVSYRTFYTDLDKREEEGELQHLQELYEAYRKDHE